MGAGAVPGMIAEAVEVDWMSGFKRVRIQLSEPTEQKEVVVEVAPGLGAKAAEEDLCQASI